MVCEWKKRVGSVCECWHWREWRSSVSSERELGWCVSGWREYWRVCEWGGCVSIGKVCEWGVCVSGKCVSVERL